MKEYDIVICGAGPAGMTAAIYSVRAGFKTLVIEKLYAGGQIMNTYEVENYPGFKSISGIELGQKMQEHAESLGAEFIYSELKEIKLKEKIIILDSNEEIKAKKIILSMGVTNRNTGLESENKFAGRGVHYCATCDGAFYKGKTVMILGGGQVAVEDALYLSKFAKKVYLVHRRDQLRAVSIEANNILNSDIEILWNSNISEICGDKKVTSVKIINVKTNEVKEVPIDGLFIAIGQVPQSQIVKNQIKCNEQGYIIVDEKMKTSIDDVFACGDITTTELKQIITACANGAIAADSAIKELM